MLQNLFSVLSEEQLQSLTKEERQTLAKLDEKLFPDYDKYVDEHMRAKSDIEKVMERRRKQEEDDLQYRQMMEQSFT